MPTGKPQETKDFFVSYNHTDREWAEWIAWVLEEGGFSTIVQAWDFASGSNFVLQMQKATGQAKRTVAVLSPAYLASKFTQAEWAAAFANDPTGEKRMLIPVRVRTCDLEGLLPQIVYVDLVDVEEVAAQRRLLEAASDAPRMKPAVKPRFPESPKPGPTFPGFQGRLNTDALEDGEPACGPAFNTTHPSRPEESRAIAFPPRAYVELTGREREMDEAFLALLRPDTHWVVAIDGMGGIGKTAVALELVRRSLRDRRFDIALWQSAKSERFVGHGIERQPSPQLTFGSIVESVKYELGSVDTLKHRRVLVVLDNLDTAGEDQDTIVHRILPLLNPSKLLVTTRHKLSGELKTIHLAGLQDDDAVLFIQRDAREKAINRLATAERPDLLKMVRSTGGAPLAMKLVVGQLAYLSLDDILHELKNVAPSGMDYEFYRFLFRPSWNTLSRHSRKLLVSMSHFSDMGADKTAVLSVSGLREDEFPEAIRQLWRTSLLETSGKLDHARYWLHPLTQHFVLSDIVRIWE